MNVDIIRTSTWAAGDEFMHLVREIITIEFVRAPHLDRENSFVQNVPNIKPLIFFTTNMKVANKFSSYSAGSPR